MRGSKYIVMRNTLENNRKPCINPAHNMWSGMATQSWTYRWAVRVTKNAGFTLFFFPILITRDSLGPATSTGTPTPTEPMIAGRTCLSRGVGGLAKAFQSPVSLWLCRCNRDSNFLTTNLEHVWNLTGTTPIMYLHRLCRNVRSQMSSSVFWSPHIHMDQNLSYVSEQQGSVVPLLLHLSHIFLSPWIFTLNYLGSRYKPVFPAVWHFPPCILIQKYIAFLNIHFVAEHSNTQPSHRQQRGDKNQLTHQIVGGSDPSTSR